MRGRPRREPARLPVAASSGAPRLLRLLAERLESFLAGEELVFETLGEAIEESHATDDDLETTILALRGAAAAEEDQGDRAGVELETAPGKHAQRVWSKEERESLSPEAWGYLLDLRRRGSLDDGQFERVLDFLTGCGVRPVGVELAREVAARVALEGDDTGRLEGSHGEFDQTH